jgi:hypothetical protein
MKKNILVIALLITSVLIISSCNKKAKNTTSSETSTETISNNEQAKQEMSFVTLKNHISNKYADASYYINYPDKNDTSLVAKNIRLWVNKQMGNKYKGNLSNADSMMNWYESKFIKTSTKEIKQIGDNTQYSSMDSIYLSYETNKVISLVAGNYIYQGGAHGGYNEVGNTFNVLTGKSYGWNMVKDKKALRKYIKSGLKKYFKVKTDKDLVGQLLGDIEHFTVNSIPLPQNPPYFTKDGLKLSYGQYEIACYAAGMPYVIIPFNQLDNILTPEVLEMIK